MSETVRTLVTGFGPFMEVTENPSAIIAASIDRPHRVLEVSYRVAEEFVFGLDEDSFDRLVLLGVASGRDRISLETLAHNLHGDALDVRQAARAGPIVETAPPILASTLFTEDRLPTLVAGEPGLQVSRDAGRYLCNFAYFLALRAFPAKRVGFIHVTPIDRIAIEDQIELVRRVIERAEALG